MSQRVRIFGRSAHRLELSIDSAARVHVDNHVLHARHEFRRFRELFHFRRQLLHRQTRVSGVQHRPDHAAAICFVDQREKPLVAQQSFFSAKAHFDHFFEHGAMTKRGGVRVDEKEEQIVRSRTSAERVERVAARLKRGELLLLEVSFR